MARIILNKDSLKYNYDYLCQLFEKEGIGWAIVSKLLCGDPIFLRETLDLGHNQYCDSRVSHLRLIKKIRPDVTTIYIKPPAKRSVKNVVNYADISLNTTKSTIKLLSKEAVQQNKVHKIVLMVELGELREGILTENIEDFYEFATNLPNIKVIGLGTNLTCLNGILPSYDKMSLLVMTQKLLESKYNTSLPLVSGGTSVTIPLLKRKLIPKGLNHFRVGETLFFGTDVYDSKPIQKMRHDVFALEGQIVELKEKPLIPFGKQSLNLMGETPKFDKNWIGKTTTRALLDVGLLDVDYRDVTPKDKSLSIIGSSSDMMVLDLRDNPKGYKVGDVISFTPNYMGVLRLMSSKYVKKIIR